MNTIVALSTPIGRSAVAVVRMSGTDSIEIAKKIFSPFPHAPNFLRVGRLATQHFVEHAMCVFFAAPKSFTGENLVEFHCHGGIEVPKAVIEACLSHGAVMAKNGEFSKRAFVNGKLNLSNAEGMIEMIDAQTATAVKVASNLLENRLGKVTVEIQDSLTDLISQTEVALDYPEEDLEMLTAQTACDSIKQLIAQLDKLLATVGVGRLVKDGINIALFGDVNVGKSSLLNAIVGCDRAIVSDIAGTTRDTISESVVYKNVKFTFVDTAGIRDSNDSIENQGVVRAKKAVENADLVLHVVDLQQLALQKKVSQQDTCMEETTQQANCKVEHCEKRKTEDCCEGASKDCCLSHCNAETLKQVNCKVEHCEKRKMEDCCVNADQKICLKDICMVENQIHSKKPVLTVFNKMDAFSGQISLSDRQIAVSAKFGDNIEQLLEKIYQLFDMGQVNSTDLILTNVRHVDCLNVARKHLQNALDDTQNVTLDCVALHLRNAWEVLGEITGTTANEDIIDRIYSKFCLGK